MQELNKFSGGRTTSRFSCPVQYWHERPSEKLSKVAMDALLPMASSVSSERIASKLNYFVGDLKTRVADEYLSKCIFLHSLPKDIQAQLAICDIED